MRSLIAIALIVLVSVAGSAEGQAPVGPATMPATQPTPLDALKRHQRETVERQYAGRPVVGPVNANEVVQIEIDHGRITVDTTLPPAGVEQRIKVNDDPGLWLATINHRPDGAPQSMFVQRYDFSSPDNVFTHAMVAASTTQVSLAGAVEDHNGMTQIELIDRSPMVTPEEGIVDPGGIRVFVLSYNAEGMRTANLRVEAPDFHALREAQPEIVNTYLARLLRDLGQEHILAVDAKLAWQVLGGEQPVDPQVMQQLRAILPKLDADAFAEREQAADALHALGEDGAAAIARLDRASLTPEQNARIDEFLNDFQPVSHRKASALADDPHFLLDVLLVDDAQLRKLALDRLNERLDQPVDFDVDAPRAQRAEQIAAIRRLLRAGTPTTAPAQ